MGYEFTDQEVVEAYERFKSINKVARYFVTGAGRIRAILLENGIVHVPEPPRTIPEATKDEVSRLYRERKLTNPEIMQELNISIHTLHKIAKERNLSKKPTYTNAQRIEVIRQYAKLKSVKKVIESVDFAVNRQTVTRWVRESGIISRKSRRLPNPSRYKPPTYDDGEIIRLYQELGTGQQVANIVGCSTSLVYLKLKQHNMPVNRRGRIKQKVLNTS